MNLIGPAERAKHVRAAAIRLRREVDYCLGIMPGSPRSTLRSSIVASEALPALAETLAVLRHILRAIDELGASTEHTRELLRTELLAWERYHEVTR